MVLNQLLSDGRVRRMFDAEATHGKSAYTVGEMVTELTNGVWSELGTKKPSIDIYRRNIQRTFLTTMDGKTNANSDLKLYVKDALRGLAKKIDKALPNAADRMTALHLKDSRAEIEKILLGKSNKPAAAPFDLSMLFGFRNRDICNVDGKNVHSHLEIEK